MHVGDRSGAGAARSLARSAVIAGLLVVAVLAAACDGKTSSRPADLGAEGVSDWFGRATQVLLPCEESSKLVGDALDAEEMSNDNAATSIPIVLAAGQAVEECTGVLDLQSDPQWEEFRNDWPDAGAALLARVQSLLSVDEAALLAAATNLDNRSIVGRLYEAARAADATALELEEQIRSVASSLGIDVPGGESLYRWNPPDH